MTENSNTVFLVDGKVRLGKFKRTPNGWFLQRPTAEGQTFHRLKGMFEASRSGGRFEENPGRVRQPKMDLRVVEGVSLYALPGHRCVLKADLDGALERAGAAGETEVDVKHVRVLSA